MGTTDFVPKAGHSLVGVEPVCRKSVEEQKEAYCSQKKVEDLRAESAQVRTLQNWCISLAMVDSLHALAEMVRILDYPLRFCAFEKLEEQ